MGKPFEKIVVALGCGAMLCYGIVIGITAVQGVRYLLNGEFVLGAIAMGFVGVLLFIGSIILHVVSGDIEVEKYVGM